MVNYIASQTELTAVADAIRAKAGTSDALAFPDGFVSAIGSIKDGDAGGGNAQTFVVSARAYIPTVKKVQVDNVLTIPVTTSATGGIKSDT